MKKRKIRIAIFDSSRRWIGGGIRIMECVAAHLSKKYYVKLFTQLPPRKYLDFGKAKITLIKPQSGVLAPLTFLIKKVKNFDMLITDGFPTNLGSIRNQPCINICTSPNRVFYDLKDYLYKTANLKGKIKMLIKTIFLKHIDYLAAQRNTKILGISKNVRERVRKYYYRDSEIFYIGFYPKRFKTGKYRDYILCVSRFVAPKRADVIVKSMGYVKNKKIKLYVVGDGEEKEKIKKLCQKYPNVTFLGFVSEKKLINLYANCKACVYVPVNEDWGLVPLEAGASGKATIGANEGGLRETIVNNKTGFLLNKVTPQEIAKKIDFFAKNKKEAIKMGKQAKKHTKQFKWKNTLKALDKAVEEILKKTKRW